LIGLPPSGSVTEAERVAVSARVEETAKVATPLTVSIESGEILSGVLPPLLRPELRVTLFPLNGFPYASFTVTVTVAVLVPSAVTGSAEASTVDVDEATGPGATLNGLLVTTGMGDAPELPGSKLPDAMST
jgi:hypothetical protein